MKTWLDRIEEARSPAEIRKIIQEAPTSQEVIFRAVAQHAKAWDEALLLIVLADGRSIYQLSTNKALPEWARAQLAAWCVRRLESEEKALPGVPGALRSLLGIEDLSINSSLAQRLEKIITTRAQPSWRKWEALDVLLVHPGITTEILSNLKHELTDTYLSRSFTDLVRTPKISPEAVALLLDRAPANNSEAGINHLLEKQRFRKNPRIRDSLLNRGRRQKVSRIYQGILADNPADTHSLFRELAAIDADAAGTSLLRGEDALLAHLNPEDLRPLLESNRQETRLRAIAALGKLTYQKEKSLDSGKLEAGTKQARKKKSN